MADRLALRAVEVADDICCSEMCRQAGGRPSGCAGRSVDRRPLVRGHRLKYLAYSISSAHAAECRVYFCPGNLVFPTRDSLRPEPARPAMEHSWAADRQSAAEPDYGIDLIDCRTRWATAALNCSGVKPASFSFDRTPVPNRATFVTG